jgi:hypothetical protein
MGGGFAVPLKEVLLLIVVIVVLLTVPVGVIWGIVDYVKNGHRRERRGGSGGAGIGPAMMELDRLVARPSVEYVVEAQTQVMRREDDQGDPPDAPPGPPSATEG